MLNVPKEFGFPDYDLDAHPIREVENAKGYPITEYWIKQLSEFYGVSLNNVCSICGARIEIQIFKNTGVCSENCRKERDHDWEPFRGGALAP